MSIAVNKHLEKMWSRGCEFLGVRYAILGGAMSWISESGLVSAISNAGGFGVIAGGSMMPDQLGEVIKATQEKTDKPFGVNMVTMHPELDALIDKCLELNVKFIVLAGGLPSGASISRAKEGGAKVICFAPALALAKRLVRNGADALVIEGNEAGGHIGPVATSVLAQEILPEIKDVPVFVAGGIGRGEAIVSYLEMGAAGVQIGTRLVCATECIAHENFKKSFIRASARDAVSTLQLDIRFPVIPVRAIANQGTHLFMEKQKEVVERFNKGELTKAEGQLEIERFWVGSLKNAVIDGDVDNGSLMAGQSVGMVKQEQSTEEILAELINQANNAIEAKNTA
ncbi:MAG: nitronate monooxygenase [Rhodospirillaceae bacterium]|nr:nitronate monooxygenase [Rhodospirillaceae bacterium]